MPTTPAPPGLLTITSGCGEYLGQTFSIARLIRSVDPPAEAGTMPVIGLDGYLSWAAAVPVTIRAATNAKMKLLTTIRFMRFLLSA